MNVSFEWLREYVDFDMTPEALADRLTMAGLAVDEVRRVGDDWRLVIDLTANRADCLGHLGVAREVAAITGAPFRLPPVDAPTSGDPADRFFRLSVEAPDLCPRYTGRVLSGVKIGPSPDWMVRRLRTVGAIPEGQPGINNVVDITNYVLFECSQPLHAFDLNRLAGPKIVVRRARPNERMRLLGGKEIELQRDMLVIADADRPVALAGVMGGEDSMIGAGTSRVLLESASFLGRSVRLTSRALGVATESSYRFERTVDFSGVDFASRRAAYLMVKHAGATWHPGVCDSNSNVPETPTITMRKARARLVLGTNPREAVYTHGFPALGLDVVENTSDRVVARVPSFRPDLTREVDLIEEAARLDGYDRIPDQSVLRIAYPVPNPLHECREEACARLAAIGFDEAMTDSFAGGVPATDFHPWARDAQVKITEASRKYGHQTHLRDALAPMVLGAKLNNQNTGRIRVRFFEIATVFLNKPGKKLPEERPVLALVADDEEAGPDGESRVRGALESLADHLRFTRALAFRAETVPGLEPGRSAVVTIGGEYAGVAGRLSKAAATAFDFRAIPAVVELDFRLVLAAMGPAPKFRELPRFPPVERDVCLEIDGRVPWSELHAAAAESPGELMETVRFLSEYRGKGLPAGKKALAFRITYRRADRSLTNEEVQKAHDARVDRLCRTFQASVRGT